MFAIYNDRLVIGNTGNKIPSISNPTQLLPYWTDFKIKYREEKEIIYDQFINHSEVLSPTTIYRRLLQPLRKKFTSLVLIFSYLY